MRSLKVSLAKRWPCSKIRISMSQVSRPKYSVILYSRQGLSSWKTGRAIIFHVQYALFQTFEEIFMSGYTTNPATDFGSWVHLGWIVEDGMFTSGLWSVCSSSFQDLPDGQTQAYLLGLLPTVIWWDTQFRDCSSQKMRTDGYVLLLQWPCRVLRELHCIHRHVWLAGVLFPPFSVSSDGESKSMMASDFSLSNRGVLWTTA